MTAAAEPGPLRRLACALLPLAVAAAVWRPLIHNYFHGDDFLHLYQIVDLPFAQWVLMPFGGHVYLLRNAVFSLFWLVFGTRAQWWFVVVLATHVLNVAFLFRLLRAAGAGARMASAGAAWWGAARVLEGALGWYSVYGQVLVATLALPVLARVLGTARGATTAGAGAVLAWGGILLVACTAFGVGIGVALAFPVAVLLAIGWRRLTPAARVALFALPPAVIGLWLGDHALYGRLYEPAVGGTATFILGSYAAPSVVPLMLGHLLGVGVTALLDPFGNTFTDYPGPLAWGLVGGYAAALVAGLLAAPWSGRRAIVACIVLAAGCYAMIALGRAGIWNVPGIPVYGAVEPRYHYVGSALLAAALALALAALGARLRLPALVADFLLVATVAGLVVLRIRSGWAIDHHDADRQAVDELLATTSVAAALAPPGQRAIVPNRGFAPFVLVPPAYAGWATAFTVFASPELQNRVRFTDWNPATYAMARPGSRLARVLAPR